MYTYPSVVTVTCETNPNNLLFKKLSYFINTKSEWPHYATFKQNRKVDVTNNKEKCVLKCGKECCSLCFDQSVILLLESHMPFSTLIYKTETCAIWLAHSSATWLRQTLHAVMLSHRNNEHDDKWWVIRPETFRLTDLNHNPVYVSL